jgi:hypothetical protein
MTRSARALARGRMLRVAASVVLISAAIGTTAPAVSAAAAPSRGRLAARASLAGARSIGARRAATIVNPPSNIEPSAAFEQACYPAPSATCDSAALADFDSARAQEGLGPMTLPTHFDSLPIAQQVFVIADIERVDRGLVPVKGLSAPINALAETGAENDADPAFPVPFYGDMGGANWAGAGSSALFAEFLWVYDDGLGSGNEDCTQSDQSGCWGHRENILASYDSPVLMGAAETPDTTYGGSIAEEYISGDNKDSALSPLWTAVQSQFPVGLSTSSVSLPTAAAQTVPVTAWASGVDMDLTAAITTGAGAWTVTPASCDLAAGAECTLTVGWNPQAVPSTSGVLTVTGPNGPRTIALTAPGQSAPLAHLSAAGAVHTATGGASTVISGQLTDAASSAPLSGTLVTVQNRPAGRTVWTNGASSLTSVSGSVRLTVRPTANTAYRLLAAAAGGYAGTTSSQVEVDVRPRIAIAAAHRHVTVGELDRLSVTSTPAQPGQQVDLQQSVDGSWTTMRVGHLSHAGRQLFTIRLAHGGTGRFRVIEPADARHVAAASPALDITARSSNPR